MNIINASSIKEFVEGIIISLFREWKHVMVNFNIMIH